MEIAEKELNFEDTESAFQHRTDQELRRTYRLFKLIDSPFLTRIGPPLVMKALQWKLPIEGLVRETLFEIFCGGSSLVDSIPVLEKLDSFGVKTILDYSVEGEKNEEGFEQTYKELLRSIEFGGSQQSVTFVALKVSGLANIDMLEKRQEGIQLTGEEQDGYNRAKIRLQKLCEASVGHNLPLFIDAEESWIQDEIDLLAEEMMQLFNREKVYIYTTLQMYRHDRMAYLEQLLQKSVAHNYLLGVKLVRGAYLEKENERAEEKGYPSPIQAHKEATDRDFNQALRLALNHLDKLAICAGTHNEKSCALLAELMKSSGIPIHHAHISFAQLLGMSDHISFNLSQMGYRVAKYVPYGPVKAVIPYLMRRAQENTAIAGQSSREVELLKKEVDRRKKKPPKVGGS